MTSYPAAPWMWMSTNPGESTFAPKSLPSAFAGIYTCSRVPAARIFPLSMRTTALWMGPSGPIAVAAVSAVTMWRTEDCKWRGVETGHCPVSTGETLHGRRSARPRALAGIDGGNVLLFHDVVEGRNVGLEHL